MIDPLTPTLRQIIFDAVLHLPPNEEDTKPEDNPLDRETVKSRDQTS
jgi:hypothetical protein